MERREYQRIKISAEGVFISSHKSNIPQSDISMENEGILEDISESGIKITFDKQSANNILKYLKPGDVIHFNAVDEYCLFGENKTEILSGAVKYVRLTQTEDTVSLGCKFIDKPEDIEEYISDKKTSFFMEGVGKRQYLS